MAPCSETAACKAFMSAGSIVARLFCQAHVEGLNCRHHRETVTSLFKNVKGKQGSKSREAISEGRGFRQGLRQKTWSGGQKTQVSNLEKLTWLGTRLEGLDTTQDNLAWTEE